jgi:hypothetical protein
LKIVHAQVEVVALYHRLPPSLSESSCGEIGLLDYGEAAYFKSGAHFRGTHKKTRLLVACAGQRKRWSSAGSPLDLVAGKAPAGFQHSRNLPPQPLLVGDIHRDGI